MTPEALFVSMIDNMDAKMMMKMMIVLQACRGEYNGHTAADGPWTEYVKALGGKLYRPDLAPAEAPDAGPLDPPDATPEPEPVPTLKLHLTNPLFESVQQQGKKK